MMSQILRLYRYDGDISLDHISPWKVVGIIDTYHFYNFDITISGGFKNA